MKNWKDETKWDIAQNPDGSIDVFGKIDNKAKTYEYNQEEKTFKKIKE